MYIGKLVADPATQNHSKMFVPHLWGHLKGVKTYPAGIVYIGMVNWSDEPHLWWLKWISKENKIQII